MGSSSGAVSMMLMTSSRTWRRYSNTSLSGGHLNEPPIRQFSQRKKNKTKDFSQFTRLTHKIILFHLYPLLLTFIFTPCFVQCITNQHDNLNTGHVYNFHLSVCIYSAVIYLKHAIVHNTMKNGFVVVLHQLRAQYWLPWQPYLVTAVHRYVYQQHNYLFVLSRQPKL